MAFLNRKIYFEPKSAATLAAEAKAEAEEKAAAAAEFLRNLEPGQTVEGEGVFFGTCEAEGKNGLRQTFNMYAAPKDLTNKSGKKAVFKFNDAVKRVSELKNWHGHDGGNFKNDKAVYEAIKDGSYNGEWFIPTREMLCGKDVDGNIIQSNNLLIHKDAGSLSGSFEMTDASGSGCPVWYWSSTENRNGPAVVYIVQFSSGVDHWLLKDDFRLSCRPVRLEPVGPQP